MKKIVTIGGGNGQSNLLDALYRYFPKEKFHISSIVSMSDDGRTTGRLMQMFQTELGLHLPPPGDLRRCLFMMSGSKKRDEFQQYLETVIERDLKISDLSIWDYFRLVGADDDFKIFLANKLGADMLEFHLPLQSSIKGHKVGNILMANLFYNLEKDYTNMLGVMHELLEVQAEIIPVTTQKAYIRAILGNGEIIESQDRISNVAAYTSGIADLQLMEDSKHAYQNKDVYKAIKKADYIIITPGDLFTSIISNFVIGGVGEAIRKSDAKIIYIGNSTNKGGETQGLTHLDIIHKIERFLGRNIDIFICNKEHIDLSPEQKQNFQANISVKGGDFLFLSEGEKDFLEKRGMKIFQAKLLDPISLYKHDKKRLAKLLEDIL